MGLDEALRNATSSEDAGISYSHLCNLFPEDNGRVSRRFGYWLAHKSKQKSKAAVIFSVQKRPPNSNSPKEDPIELEYFVRFQFLLHAIRQIHNTGGNRDRLENLKQLYAANRIKNASFNSEDLGLLLPLIEFLSMDGAYEKFYSKLKGVESQFIKCWQFDHQFDRREAGNLLEEERSLAFGYAASHVDLIRKTVEDVALQINVSNGKAKLIENLVEEYYLLMRALLQTDVSNKKVFSKLRVNMNYAEIAEDNNVNCCITGPKGSSKEASTIYALDDAVHYWSFMSSKGMIVASPSFGLAIFVEAMGNHVSSGKLERYLVCEGFAMNQEYYKLIDKVDNPENWRTDTSVIDFQNVQKPYSLPKLVYVLGLMTAKFLKIPKFFVNACHSGIQKSAEDVVRVAAEECGLSGEKWDWDARHGEFKLLKDPYAGKDFARIDVPVGEEVKRFEYTHFLKKQPLPESLINTIKIDSQWNGEGFFDTWYHWNKFIMDTYDGWSPEERARHPYAEAVAKRGKDPQWNLGIGYCKGFEVDVEKAWEDLKKKSS